MELTKYEPPLAQRSLKKRFWSVVVCKVRNSRMVTYLNIDRYMSFARISTTARLRFGSGILMLVESLVTAS